MSPHRDSARDNSSASAPQALVEALNNLPTAVQEALKQHEFSREHFLDLAARRDDLDGQLQGAIQPLNAADLVDLPARGTDAHAALVRIGEDALRSGACALVVLAGGMATRMGGVVKALVEANPIPVPPSLVTQQMRVSEREILYRAQMQGQNVRGLSEELTAQIKEDSETKVRAGLLMGMESPSSRAGQVARQILLFGRHITTDELTERLEAISVERFLVGYFTGFGAQLPPPGLYQRVLEKVEVPLITAALVATRGNQVRAADLLGLNRNTLRKKIRELDIDLVRRPG